MIKPEKSHQLTSAPLARLLTIASPRSKLLLSAMLLSTPCMTIWKQFPIHNNMPCWKKNFLHCLSHHEKSEVTEPTTVLCQLSSLTRLINSRSDTLKKMVSGDSLVISGMKKAVQENTKHIAAIKESFDVVCVEINDMKDRVVNVESQLEKYKANAETQEKRISHLESYSRRWNLKLYGLENQDV